DHGEYLGAGTSPELEQVGGGRVGGQHEEVVGPGPAGQPLRLWTGHRGRAGDQRRAGAEPGRGFDREGRLQRRPADVEEATVPDRDRLPTPPRRPAVQFDPDQGGERTLPLLL